jgi:uncharacterized protein (DUF302 family)
MAEEIGFEVHLDQPYEVALERVVEALKEAGFGVLTQIDVQNTLKEKMDIDFHAYAILGACNPPLAHRALAQDSITGLLLPCNVTVEDDSEGGSIVRVANPEALLSIGGLESDPILKEVAREARFRLERVAEELLSR